LEVLKVSSLQSTDHPIIQDIQETLQFLLISVDFIRGIARQLSELGDILIRPLFQILKLLLQLDNSLGNMTHMKSCSELWLVDAIGFLMGFHISIPKVDCRMRKLVRG
jgi:hypothetical protein